ncbi:glutathione S-transferase family protein [Hyphomicrobium sp.]|jgi:glutathione S-transferase|uniref:glutathione S-transferase family protein n=1 Tax=Hyphomicrobium sp. TaxID=82 RepID=UPI00356438F4
MTIDFYWTSGGPFAMRGLLTLAVKKLSYRSHHLDVANQENKTPEFLVLSPSGMLPVLKDGVTVVRESQAIMFYLDRAYPAVPLYGVTPAEAGKIMQEICEQQSYADPVLGPLIGALLFRRSLPETVVRNAAERFDDLLHELDARLRQTGWLNTQQCTAADINLYPPFRAVAEALAGDTALRFGIAAPDVQSFQSVASWMVRLGSLATGKTPA